MESAVIHSSEVHEVDSGIPMILFKDFSTSLSLLQGDLHSPSLSSIVFTPPSVPPVLGDRNPKGREDVTALRCSEPLRSKVGGPKLSAPGCAGWDRLAKGGDRLCWSYYGLL